MDAPFQPTLHQNARQKFISWRSTIIEAYGQACNIYLNHGLLGFILADAAWASLPGNTIGAAIVDENPPIVNIVDRPVLPTFTPLAANATTAQQAAWDRNIKIIRFIREHNDLLKAKLITSILSDDLAALRDPVTAYLHVTPQTILAHITSMHGTLDNNDYVQLTAVLSTPMVSSNTLSGIIARLTYS